MRKTLAQKRTGFSVSDGQPKKCRNYQEIKVQEQIHMLPVGSVPRAMWVVLEDDIVDSCKPGDDVIITGKNMMSSLQVE